MTLSEKQKTTQLPPERVTDVSQVGVTLKHHTPNSDNLYERAEGMFHGVYEQQLFAPVLSPKQVDYALLENDVQTWWDHHQVLGKYLSRNKDAEKRWSFVDGPLTANNPMGVHHAWGRTYKDLWQRFNTMRGYRQRYQNGFDCQGLWVEVEVEKQLNFKSKRDIEAYGIAQFVEDCKNRVTKFAAMQTGQSIRLGEWMDWDNSYLTMSEENNYAIWGMLKRCWENGWIYKGTDVMPWCPRCATGLSDMEINDGRKKVQHTSVYVRFPLVDTPGEFLLVWTTTPWTLPANSAAAVKPELIYAKVQQDGNYYYLAESMLPKLTKLRGREHGDFTVVDRISGSALVGRRYRGPFDDLSAWQRTNSEHVVIPWNDINDTEGTGIVHIAPGCGREDFALSKEQSVPLPLLAPVDENGIYTEGYDWLSGRNVSEVPRAIIEELQRNGFFYQTESYEHVYPHCWRCKTELIFRLVDEWFISMDILRERMMTMTQRITWIPSFGLEREMDWLRNMEDWMISKKRYWGLALPIFECKQCSHFEVIGSKEEFQERAAEGWEQFEGNTPHRPYVDAVKIRCHQCGALVERIKDVGNPWLDAGIVPFSTLNYFQDRDYWREWYPADFITENFPGQFRNWFYSILVTAAVLEDEQPFMTVLGYATLVDERGEGMHKSKGNSIEFNSAASIVGSDTMRWMFSSQPPEQNRRFPNIPTATEVELARAAGQPPPLSKLWMKERVTLDKLWDVYRFFVTYANIDRVNPITCSLSITEYSDADCWLLSELQELITTITMNLEKYNSHDAASAITNFVMNMSNWYVRRNRRRFWKAGEDIDKVTAYLTLYKCLVTVAKLLAPFAPFFAEVLYQNLVRRVDNTAPESVHLCDWPVVDEQLINHILHDEMELVLRMVNLGHSARDKAQIRVRQPLGTLFVTVTNSAEHDALQRLGHQVLDELNVKELEFFDVDNDILVYTLHPRMQVIGPKYGKIGPKIITAVHSLDAKAAATALRTKGLLPLTIDGQQLIFTTEEIGVVASARDGYVTAEDRGYIVMLDTTLTPNLLAEGLVRDLTHYVQEIRKQAGMEIEDIIDTWLIGDAKFVKLLQPYAVYIAEETLTQHLTVAEANEELPQMSVNAYKQIIPSSKFSGYEVTVVIAKA